MRSQDSKLFRAPIYWAQHAVVFAIAQLSCLAMPITVPKNPGDTATVIGTPHCVIGIWLGLLVLSYSTLAQIHVSH